MSQKEPGLEQELLDELLKTWQENPNQRLTQLLVNVIAPREPCPGIFYVEDSRLIELLKKARRQ
ncbi:hypothetical protein GZ77_05310 [Endozoicomonas montiporae]|uniref:Uncharacterized protein n=2 Tax=Endozoicomonas montiporae TaxID=1027273 RepID=A0A081NBU7_9GAMM|nr:hypothetical protein [Endozoicomonas montiporae]AMO56231.1 hypothetical protein EZMO1_2114 [Endozoicomonas montiporae CL-33]KEQ15920.1 hypothetical protein GZ77_05310 [Endozoicomonas montiporae]